MQLLSEGRFRLGLGSGENPNEHVVGGGQPSADVRHEMSEEAVEIIRALFRGGHVNHRGAHFAVEPARLWDLPDVPQPLGIAVSGEQSCALAGRLADLVIATEPKAALLDSFDRHGGTGKPRVGRLPVCHDPDRDTAVKRAHAQLRYFGGGWKVDSELPHPDAFEGATQFVTPDAVVEAVRPYVEAGFTEIALVQIGGESQPAYLDRAEKTLLPALHDALDHGTHRGCQSIANGWI